MFSLMETSSLILTFWECGFASIKFVALAYQGKDIVFRFIMEYTSLTDFGPGEVGLSLYEYF
jgi:hypothetical protein